MRGTNIDSRSTACLLASVLWLVTGCGGDDDAVSDAAVDAGPDAAQSSGGRGGATGSGGATGTAGVGGSAQGGMGDEDGGVADGGATDGGVTLPPPADCKRFGDDCAGSGECCSGLCDPATDSCSSSVEHCAGSGDACAAATDCCDLRCNADGECEGGACVSDGEACAKDLDCCGQSCVGDVCVALNPSCKTAGNACGGSGECCSGLCDDDKCVLAASFCIQQGDVCGRAEDCCTGSCTIADGSSVGVCGAPPSGASFCNGGIEGSVCGECNDCCSRLCAPYGPTGVKVCQPASGCHVTGDFCRKDGDCCGADGTGLPGEGNVYCEKGDGADLGICRNPMSCSPQGNVCHYKEYACGVSSARANCCGGLGANGGVCQLDGLGVPRCNGLGDECIEGGEICASADDCCDDVPCVPDDEGALRCFDPPPDEPPCVPVTGPCTVNADCCVGGTCVRPVGSTEGSCQGVPTGGTGGHGGSGGAGGSTPPPCATYGQSCDGDGDCCNDVPCTDGICRVPIQ